MSETLPTSPLTVTAIKREERVCTCCGKTFYEYPYIDAEFCDRCYPVVVRAIFDKNNGNLTCSQIREKIRKELGMEE